ncbi:MAG: hypothetical protein ACRDOL_24445 [Streptosporangiaceae bacterium]
MPFPAGAEAGFPGNVYVAAHSIAPGAPGASGQVWKASFQERSSHANAHPGRCESPGSSEVAGALLQAAGFAALGLAVLRPAEPTRSRYRPNRRLPNSPSLTADTPRSL